MPFKILTMNEAAKEARITRRFLDRQVAVGKGPAITRIGCKPLVRSDELQAWLERCTSHASDPGVMPPQAAA